MKENRVKLENKSRRTETLPMKVSIIHSYGNKLSTNLEHHNRTGRSRELLNELPMNQ